MICLSRTLASRLHKAALAAVAGALMGCAAPATQQGLVGMQGDAARGMAVVIGRDGNCLLCHAIPETGARFAGNLGPALSGVGGRLSVAALRLRIEDSQKLNPDSIMPAYARTEGLTQVAQTWRGKPILSPQQIEDTVAFLVTLK